MDTKLIINTAEMIVRRLDVYYLELAVQLNPEDPILFTQLLEQKDKLLQVIVEGLSLSGEILHADLSQFGADPDDVFEDLEEVLPPLEPGDEF